MTVVATCSNCGGPAHDTTWRCEACRTVFTCASTFVERPDGIATVPCHSAFPVVGWTRTSDAVEPELGEMVTCGPIVINAGPNLTERALALAAEQRHRRERLHVVAFDDPPSDDLMHVSERTHSG